MKKSQTKSPMKPENTVINMSFEHIDEVDSEKDKENPLESELSLEFSELDEDEEDEYEVILSSLDNLDQKPEPKEGLDSPDNEAPMLGNSTRKAGISGISPQELKDLQQSIKNLRKPGSEVKSHGSQENGTNSQNALNQIFDDLSFNSDEEEPTKKDDADDFEVVTDLSSAKDSKRMLALTMKDIDRVITALLEKYNVHRVTEDGLDILFYCSNNQMCVFVMEMDTSAPATLFQGVKQAVTSLFSKSINQIVKEQVEKHWPANFSKEKNYSKVNVAGIMQQPGHAHVIQFAKLNGEKDLSFEDPQRTIPEELKNLYQGNIKFQSISNQTLCGFATIITSYFLISAIEQHGNLLNKTLGHNSILSDAPNHPRKIENLKNLYELAYENHLAKGIINWLSSKSSTMTYRDHELLLSEFIAKLQGLSSDKNPAFALIKETTPISGPQQNSNINQLPPNPQVEASVEEENRNLSEPDQPQEINTVHIATPINIDQSVSKNIDIDKQLTRTIEEQKLAVLNKIKAMELGSQKRLIDDILKMVIDYEQHLLKDYKLLPECPAEDESKKEGLLRQKYKITSRLNTELRSESLSVEQRLHNFVSLFYDKKDTLEIHRNSEDRRFYNKIMAIVAIILTGIVPGLIALSLSKSSIFSNTSRGSDFVESAKTCLANPPASISVR